MQDCKPISLQFPINCMLLSRMSLSSEAKRMKMSRVPCVSMMSSLINVMIYTEPDTTKVMRVVSRIMTNHCGEHYKNKKHGWQSMV